VSNINEICTRAILLDQGELLLEGSPKLVTIYYQKLLFATPQNAVNVRNELIQLNQNHVQKRKFASEFEGTEQTPAVTEKAQEPKQHAFYIPDLKPKSTVITRNHDVEIFDFHLRTLDHEPVNVLVTDEEYILAYKVKFGSEATKVFSSIIFKTEKGMRLGSDPCLV
jgi:lipopolysaccharide transport system ATP-binding protein